MTRNRHSRRRAAPTRPGLATLAAAAAIAVLPSCHVSGQFDFLQPPPEVPEPTGRVGPDQPVIVIVTAEEELQRIIGFFRVGSAEGHKGQGFSVQPGGGGPGTSLTLSFEYTWGSGPFPSGDYDHKTEIYVREVPLGKTCFEDGDGPALAEGPDQTILEEDEPWRWNWELPSTPIDYEFEDGKTYEIVIKVSPNLDEEGLAQPYSKLDTDCYPGEE